MRLNLASRFQQTLCAGALLLSLTQSALASDASLS